MSETQHSILGQTVTLAPCPFCGGDARPDGWPVDCIGCESCGASGPRARHQNRERQAFECVTSWNRRASERGQ